jgi:RNA polymerase sigma-70 factor (ECF subfamily)
MGEQPPAQRARAVAPSPERFRGPGDQWPGGWVAFPPSWGPAPEQRLPSGEVQQLIGAAIGQLPPGQREVVVLRDVQGWTAQEVSQVLEVSEATQRVLLHRGRSKLRRRLAHDLAGE